MIGLGESGDRRSWCRFGLTRSGGWAILRQLSDEGPSGFRIGLDPVVTVIVESCPAPSRTPEPAAPHPRRVGRSRQEDRTSWTRLAVSPLERIDQSRQPLEQDTDGHAPELVGGHAGRVDVVGTSERRWRPGRRTPSPGRATTWRKAMPARRSRIWRTSSRSRRRPPSGISCWVCSARRTSRPRVRRKPRGGLKRRRCIGTTWRSSIADLPRGPRR